MQSLLIYKKYNQNLLRGPYCMLGPPQLYWSGTLDSCHKFAISYNPTLTPVYYVCSMPAFYDPGRFAGWWQGEGGGSHHYELASIKTLFELSNKQNSCSARHQWCYKVIVIFCEFIFASLGIRELQYLTFTKQMQAIHQLFPLQ